VLADANTVSTKKSWSHTKFLWHRKLVPLSNVLFTAQARNKISWLLMNWGILWYIDFADWSFISPCTEAIQTYVNFLVGTHSFTQYVLVQFMANQNFAKTAGFRSAGHKLHFFSLYLFVYLFENIIFSWFICAYCFKRKNGWRASRINYWNTHKPVRLVLSYVLSVTQQYKQRTAWKASLQSIQPSRNIRRIATLVKRTPHILIGKSHNTSISAISNSFHNILSKA